MKAFVLAAGFGTRLGEITKTTPKCLVELAPGVPILEIIIRKIELLGINDIVVNTHYLADKVESFIGARRGSATITISHEPKILETGGGMLAAKKYFNDDNVLVHNGDIYSTFDLQQLIAAHQKHHAEVTLGTLALENDRPLFFDQESKLVSWKNKKTNEEMSARALAPQEVLLERQYACVAIYSPSFFDVLLGRGEMFSVVPAWFDAAKKGMHVQSCELSGEWVDIGTPKQLEQARNHYNKSMSSK